MKVLICGAGRATRSVLTSLGVGWDVTVVDNGGGLESLMREVEAVSNVFSGDASSPVVLGRAGLANQDWVLALTSDDEVNLSVVRFAVESGIRNVVGRAMAPENRRAMEEAGARAFSGVAAMAVDIVQYMRNPGVRVIPVARGRGEVLEVEVNAGSGLVGRALGELESPGWFVAGLFRGGQMLRNDPKLWIVEGDVLVVVAEPGMYEFVCSAMECMRTDFPQVYGRNLLTVLQGEDEERDKALLAECMYFIQGAGIEGLMLLADEDSRAERDERALWSESVDFRVLPRKEKFFAQMEAVCGTESVCLAVIPWAETSLLRSLTGRTPLKLAHSLRCPLLVAKGAGSYKRILVPFTGSERTLLALDAALQMAARFGAEVCVILVRQPAFLSGGAEDWVHGAVEDARALARGRGMRLDEEIREGNPVLEVTDMARDYDLVVLGSRTTEGRGFLTPGRGEHIVDRAPCSVLVITG